MCFPQKCDAFFASIVSNLRITTGARPVIHVHHGRMCTLVRVAILRLRCLHACIFWLKSYKTYVNTIMLGAIISLIALFTFTFMHLADAFIQSDLHCIQVTVSTFYQLLLSLGLKPMILALLAPCSTSWATGKPYLNRSIAFTWGKD